MVAKPNPNSQQEEKYNRGCSLCTFDSRKLVGYVQKNQKAALDRFKQSLCFSFNSSTSLIDMSPSSLTVDAPAAITSYLGPPLPHGSLPSVRTVGPTWAGSDSRWGSRRGSTGETVRIHCCHYIQTLFLYLVFFRLPDKQEAVFEEATKGACSFTARPQTYGAKSIDMFMFRQLSRLSLNNLLCFSSTLSVLLPRVF